MNKISIFCFGILFAGSTFLNTTSAQTDLKDIVLERKLTMRAMLRDYFPLLSVSKGESIDLAKAAESARQLKDNFTKSLQLFPKDTAKGQVPGSRAKPEIWSNPSEFNNDAASLNSSISKLIDIAESNNLDEFKDQFSIVEQACIGCHEFKPSGGGKFRFAK